MKYFIIILLACSFSLQAVALASSPDTQESRKTLQKIQKNIKTDGMCDPQKTLKMPTFN